LPQPAYVLGRRWDVLAWNRAAADLLGFGRLAEGDRNVLVAMLTNPRVRDLFGAAWADEARRMVSEFRATHDLWAGDPAFVALIARLHDGCPEFGDWWQAHDIRTGTAGRKRFHHPKLGLWQFDHTSFQSNDDPALKLVIYTPA
ncbi:transcriptional regulator, partial [Marinibaculum pumilum]